jgi:hypothetical protein
MIRLQPFDAAAPWAEYSRKLCRPFYALTIARSGQALGDQFAQFRVLLTAQNEPPKHVDSIGESLNSPFSQFDFDLQQCPVRS